MTRSQLEYILTLDKLRNFGEAAKACFVTQSTLSAMVAKFELQNGVEVFNRNTRPISITSDGELVIKSLKNIYREYQLLDEKINEIKGYEIGQLSIACIPTVAPYLYPLVLNIISERFPKVNFKIFELTTETMVDELVAGNIDIGIASTPLEHKELKEFDLYEEDFVIYDCGNKTKSKRFKVSDIDLDRLWLLEEGHCLRNQVGKICEMRQKKKMKGNLVYSCGSIYTLIEMVKKNNGVTLLPRLALVNNTELKTDNIYNLSKPVPSRKIGFICHKNFSKNRLIKSLAKIVEVNVKIHLGAKSKGSFIVSPF